MKIKGPKSKLRITSIFDREKSKSGKGVKVRLLSGVEIWLPSDHVDFQTDEWNGHVAVIPLWLKKKIMKELNNDGSTEETPQNNDIPF